MPYVATLRRRSARPPRGRHPRRGRPRRRRRPRAAARRRDPGHRLDGGVHRGRGRGGGRAVARLGGVAGHRRALGQHPRAVHGPGPRRGRRLHRPGDQHPRPDVRHGAGHLRDGGRGRRRRGDPGARPQRADLHVPAPDRLRDGLPCRRRRRRLAGSGLPPGRPLPVQRQEVRDGPGVDDRGDPAGLPPRDRGRLPQHRHRLARRSWTSRTPTVEEQQRANYVRTAELVGPHPDPRDGWRHGQRRRRDRRGRQVELDRGRAAGVSRRAPRASSRGSRPARSGSARSACRPARPTAASSCPTGRVAKVAVDFDVHRRLGAVARAEYGLAGTVQHGASTLPDEMFHTFREVETAEIHLATGFQNALYEHPAFPAELHARIEGWCFENALDERKADQTDQQFVYTTRKKAIGPFKRELWDLADEGRDPRGAGGQDRVPVPGARGGRIARHGRSLRAAGGAAPAGAGSGRRGGCGRRPRRADSAVRSPASGRLARDARAVSPGSRGRAMAS